MGKAKKLRNTAKLRHAPFNEELSSTVRVKERTKSKSEDKSTPADVQVMKQLMCNCHTSQRVGSG